MSKRCEIQSSPHSKRWDGRQLVAASYLPLRASVWFGWMTIQKANKFILDRVAKLREAVMLLTNPRQIFAGLLIARAVYPPPAYCMTIVPTIDSLSRSIEVTFLERIFE